MFGWQGLISGRVETIKVLAERSGFEPENRNYPVTHLAGGRFRPLSHLSEGNYSTARAIMSYGPGPNGHRVK